MDHGDELVAAMRIDMITRDQIDTMSRSEYDRRQNEQFAVFEQLRACVKKLLERFGKPDFLPRHRRGDYAVHGDYSEYPQVVVFVHNLELLRQPVVAALQQLLKRFPGWHIDLMVGLWDHLKDWPDMGISIRADEIVDDLQRKYFPPEYKNIAYEHSRKGNVLDTWKS